MSSTTTRQNRPLSKGTIRLLAAGTTFLLTTSACVLLATPPAGTCGARVAHYTYQRPFSDKALWNVPVCNLPASRRSADWVTRFWDWSALRAARRAPTRSGARRARLHLRRSPRSKRS